MLIGSVSEEQGLLASGEEKSLVLMRLYLTQETSDVARHPSPSLATRRIASRQPNYSQPFPRSVATSGGLRGYTVQYRDMCVARLDISRFSEQDFVEHSLAVMR